MNEENASGTRGRPRREMTLVVCVIAAPMLTWYGCGGGAAGAEDLFPSECPDENYEPPSTPLFPVCERPLRPIQQIAVGKRNACALDDDGYLHCWSASGETGWWPTCDRYVQVEAGPSLSTRAGCLFALAEDGSVDVLCDDNAEIEEIDCFGPGEDIRARLVAPRGWTTIDGAERNGVCGLTEEGVVVCENDHIGCFELGEDHVVPFSGPVVDITNGGSQLCGILEGGKVECFGSGFAPTPWCIPCDWDESNPCTPQPEGCCEDSGSIFYKADGHVPSTADVIEFESSVLHWSSGLNWHCIECNAAGDFAPLALGWWNIRLVPRVGLGGVSTRRSVCGINVFDELRCVHPVFDPSIEQGDGLSPAADPPRLENVKQFEHAAYHGCALHFDGQVTCWGSNRYGILDVPKFPPRLGDGSRW